MINRFKLLMALIIGVLISVSSAKAENILRVGDAIITYETGQIDLQNLNGKAKNVRIIGARDNIITFDEYEFKTIPFNNQTKVEIFNVVGAVIENDEGDVVTIQKANWSGMVLPVAEFNFEALMFDDRFLDQIENFGQFSIDNFDFFEEGQQIFHIDTIAFTSAIVDVPNLSNIPVQDAKIELDNIVIFVDASHDQEFLDTMERLGLNQVVINANIGSVVDVQPNRVNNVISSAVELKGMGQIEVTLSIGMLNSSLQILNAAVTQPEAEISDELVGLMFSGGMFNNTRVTIQDQGILGLLLEDFARDQGVTQEEAVNLLMDQLAISMGSFAPLTFATIAPEIRKFLMQGGELSLALTPDQPTVFSSFLGFAAVPDTAADVLGLSVEHQMVP